MSLYDRMKGFSKDVKDRAREINRYHIMRDAQLKNATPAVPFDKKIWDEGMNWFNSGHVLEDADEKLRTNTNFIHGFEFAQRKKTISTYLLNQGEEWFLNGNDLKDAPEKVVNNEFFIKGYNDAKNGVKRGRR